MSKFFRKILYAVNTILILIILFFIIQVYYLFKVKEVSTLISQGEYNKALLLYNKIDRFAISSKPASFYYTGYKIHKNLCNFEDAELLLKKTIEKDKYNQDILKYELSVLLYKQNKIDSAINTLQDIIDRNNIKNAEIYHFAGVLFYEIDDLHNAKKYYQKAYKLKPTKKILSDLNLIISELNYQDNLKEIQGKNFIIKYYSELDRKIPEYILQILENLHNKISSFIFFENKHKTVVKIFDISTFNKIVNPFSHKIVATAINNKLLIKAPNLIITFGNLHRVILHEYIHLFLHKLAKQGIPVWLQEGLAEFFSQNELSQYQKNILKSAILKNKQFSLSSLSKSWDKIKGDELTLAYAQSYSITTFIVNKYSTANLIKIIHLISCGKSFNEAVILSLGITQKELENEYLEYIRAEY